MLQLKQPKDAELNVEQTKLGLELHKRSQTAPVKLRTLRVGTMSLMGGARYPNTIAAYAMEHRNCADPGSTSSSPATRQRAGCEEVLTRTSAACFDRKLQG